MQCEDVAILGGAALAGPDDDGLDMRRRALGGRPLEGDLRVGRDAAAVFVLDGEIVMQALVKKPERLRPVVEELNRRSSLR